MKNKITEEQMINDLKRVARICSKIPIDKDYRQYGNFNRATIQRHFGSWNKALQLTFGKVNRTHGPIIQPHPCLKCGTLTKNRKFCSNSCAAITNNSKYPKRQKQTHTCLKCGKPTVSKTTSCQNCFRNECIEAYGQKRLSEFKSTFARHRYQNVRFHAHRIAVINRIPKACPVCSYDLHTQLCHRIPISKFPKDALLKDINAPENIVFLCSNHHWEIEHGYRDAKTLQPMLKLSKSHKENGASEGN